ncbi:hypothetical protein ACS0TY_017125 [Phlomoides rotata]
MQNNYTIPFLFPPLLLRVSILRSIFDGEGAGGFLTELEGWVRNCRDGSVEALFSGAPEKVEDMEQRCRSLFAKLCEKRNIDDLVTNVGSGGGGGGAVGSGGGDDSVFITFQEEEKEESDDDMGFGLFD